MQRLHRYFSFRKLLELEELEPRILFSWTPLGPAPQQNGQYNLQGEWVENVTGQISVLAFGQDNSRREALFLGAATGGAWRSTNFASNNPTWVPLTDFAGLPGPGPAIDPQTGLGAGAINVSAIAVDPNDKRRLFIGTGNSYFLNFTSDRDQYGSGILRSVNGGDQFTLLTGGASNPFFRRAISKIIIDPRPGHSNTLYASVVNVPVNGLPGSGAGIYKNTQGGDGDWTLITGTTQIGANISVSDMDYTLRGTTFTLFAGVVNHGANSGIYRSTDDGATWSRRNPAFTGTFARENISWITLAADHSPQGIALFAAVVDRTTENLQNVYKTDNSAASWAGALNPPQIGTHDGFVCALAADWTWGVVVGGVIPRGGHGVYYNPGFQANAWTPIDGLGPEIPHTDVHAFALRNDDLYVGTDGGLWRFEKDWTNLNNAPGGTPLTGAAGTPVRLLTHQVYSVAIKPNDTNFIVAGTQDNRFTLTKNGGTSWQTLLGFGDGILARFDPTSPNRLYIMGPGGRLRRIDDVTAANILPPNEEPGTALAPLGVIGNFSFFTPFAINPRSGNILLGASNSVYLSEKPPAGPWRNTAHVQSGSGLSAVAYAPGAGGVWGQILYAGVNDGGVFRSDNDGAAWTPLAHPWGNNRISSIVPDANNPGRVYLTVERFGVPQVWGTTDSGANWTNITGNTFGGMVGFRVNPNGLPNLPVHTLVIDPLAARRTVYVGNDAGVYQGVFQGGAPTNWSWSRFDTALPHIKVTDLQLQNRLLVAATYGRGVWKLQLPAEGGGGGGGGGAGGGVGSAFNAVEGAQATNVTLGTFTDTSGASSYTVSVNWGDGTAASSGTVTISGSTRTVKGSHTYSEEGSYAVTVTIDSSLVLNGTGNVSDADLTGTAQSISGTVGTPISNVLVATFTDANPGAPVADFTATIKWGDGAVSTGTITANGGHYDVKASHMYENGGNYNVEVSILDEGGASTTVTSTASISGAIIVQLVPFTAQAKVSTGTITVATFTDSAPTSAGNYTATIVWGDGQISTGTVIDNGGGSFTVKGSHTYQEAGIYLLSVYVRNNVSGASGLAKGFVAVTASGVTPTGTRLGGTQGVPLRNPVVASFSNGGLASPAGFYRADIHWGDADQSRPEQGTVLDLGNGNFAVRGEHTYRQAGSYTVTTTISGGDGSWATATSTVSVAGAAPAVTGLDTTFGSPAGGTVVSIQGNNLYGATALSFGGTAATTFRVNEDGSITAVAPAGSAGTVDVTVTTAYGTSATGGADQFTYLAGAPSVTALSAGSGPTGGGGTVTLTGTNLHGAYRVYFGTVPVDSFIVTSGTTLDAVAPAQLAGTVNVTVVGPYGTSATGSGNQYSYTGTGPAVTALDHPSGPTAGGDIITITGTNLNGATAVQFGSTAASSFTVVSSTAIVATAPAGTAGTVYVTVQTPYGTSSTGSANQYTYVAAPAVSGLSPTSGTASGGTSVAISGSNFSNATLVLFGNVAATSFTINSATSITALAPARLAGTVDVTVLTAGGFSAVTSADQFTYQGSASTVGATAPGLGTTAGSPAVTITGQYFTWATAVGFSGVAATSFSINSDTSITAVAPAGSAGAVAVQVTNPYGTSSSGSASFSYASAAQPEVTGLNTDSGAMAGGGTLIISGTAFTAATQVLVGDVPASSFTVNSDSQISVSVPARAAATVAITVTTPYGTSWPNPAGWYTYLAAAPAVTGISPSTGSTAGATTVSISGSNFMAATGVLFGTVPASSFTVSGDGSITATSPVNAAGTVDVRIVSPWGTSAIVSADQYTYTAASNVPAVTGISPTSGPTGGGTVLALTGSSFTGASLVLFGGAPAVSFVVNSATSISATAPAGVAGTIDVTVTTPQGSSATSSSDQFSYTGTAPAVTAIAPASGPATGGTLVIISGSNFNGATAVTFGTTAAASFTVDHANQVTATAPAGTAGTVHITVTTGHGTSATSTADQFTYTSVSAPSISAVSPNAGPMAGGNLVTVTGSPFTGTTAVSFGSVPAASFTVISGTQIVAVSPSQPSGTVDIRVTTPGGTSSVVTADQFTYSTTAPVLASVSPASGAAAGGTSVTIVGTGFSGATAVTFGSVAASSFTVNSATQITATSPSQSAGIVEVTITTSGGTSAVSGNDQFTYVAAAPTVTGLSPTTGGTGGGTAVTVTGTAFSGAFQVLFGTAPAFFVVNSATSITAYSPLAAAATVDVTIFTPAGISAVSSADQFTYQSGSATPSVSGLSPTSGPASGGSSVTISGSNLGGALQVWFGAVPADSFLVNSNGTITAMAPLQAAGTYHVVVTTLGGTSSTSSADQFTYNNVAPAVTGISPTTGTTAGGTLLTITGTDLAGATQVLVGSQPANSFSVISNTSIIALAPVSATGTVHVTVTTPSGTSATSSADQFTYSAASNLPTVTGVSPTSGATGGGTTVTISGTNFSNVWDVFFGTVPASAWTVASTTSLTATAPYQAAGTVDVTVMTAGGISSTGTADQYTYTGTPPTVTAISPASGPMQGGSQVTVTGTNLNGPTAVQFGSTAASAFTVVSSTQVLATAPSLAAATYHITVTTPHGTSATSSADQWTAVAAPTVTAISPTSGTTLGGTAVTITGTNFSGLVAVGFGGMPASAITVDSSTQITATAPAQGPGIVDVTVTTSAGTSALSSADEFTYPVPVPAVTAVSASAGPINGGNSVTVSGSRFTGATGVFFGTLAASTFTVSSDTQIAVTVPSLGQAGTVDVTVATPYGTTATAAADQYTYVAAPAVSGISPTSGTTLGGTTVTVTGSNFTGATALAFGSTAASSFTINSATQITATSPAQSAGTVHVIVTSPGGASAQTSADQFTYVAPPAVTALAPSSGPTAGGTSVTITGTGFSAATSVLFGSTAASSFTVNSSVQISATAPAQSAGTVHVTVTTAYGTSATSSADQYTYVAAPTVTAVVPPMGPTGGGTSVTITGTNFSGATAVTFGTSAASSFTVNSSTQITATSPAHSAGTVHVTVTTAGGTSATSSSDQFTYGMPLYFAGPAVEPPEGAPVLTRGQVQPLLHEGIRRWTQALADDEVRQQLRHVEIRLTDLADNLLGLTTGQVIWIDQNAAGHGWFVDRTFRSDLEFDIIVSQNELQASDGSPAAGKVDLLTGIMHELGRVLGFPDAGEHQLMAPALGLGIRYLPEPAGSAATAEDHGDGSFSGILADIELLPPSDRWSTAAIDEIFRDWFVGDEPRDEFSFWEAWSEFTQSG